MVFFRATHAINAPSEKNMKPRYIFFTDKSRDKSPIGLSNKARKPFSRQSTLSMSN